MTAHNRQPTVRSRSANVAAGVVLGAVCLAIALAFWVARTIRVADAWVEHTHQVLDAAQELGRDAALAQAEYRGFLITRDPRFHDDYHRTVTGIDSSMQRLAELTTDNPGRIRQLGQLHGLLADQSAFRDSVILIAARDPSGARHALDDTAASMRRGSIEAMLLDIEAQERALLAERLHQERVARQFALAVLVGMLCGAIALGAWVVRELRRQAHSLASSEARYRILTDDSPDGVLVLSGGRVRYANSAAAEMWGLGHAEHLLGRAILELIHPDDREVKQERIRSVTESGVRTSPRIIKLLRLDGGITEVEGRGSPVEFDGERAVQVIVRDVSERRRAQAALALSEARFRSVLEGMSEGVVLLNATGAIQLWNPAAERILGLTRQQFAERTTLDPRWQVTNEDGVSLSGDQRPGMVALRTGVPAGGYLSVDRGDRERAWIRVTAVPLRAPGDAAPQGVITTFVDMTPEREARQRIAESEARYRLLADNSHDMVSRRTLDDRIEYASPSHELVLGWAPAEMEGRSAFDFLHPEDAERIRNGPRRMVQAGERAGPMEVRVRHKAGHYVWVESVVTPLKDGAGTPTGYLVAARDISDRREVEEQLRHSQKMEAMGRMASAVAHDFNNLLTIIRSTAELEQGDRQAGRHGESHLEDLIDATERASALTAMLLAFSRHEHSEPAVVQVAPTLRGAVELLSRLTAPVATVELDITAMAEDANIVADALQFERALFDLVINARDASPDGSRIEVRCDVTRLVTDRVHRFGTIPAGEYVTVAVRDTGRGMDEAVLSRLFEPFFTTKPQGEGTGLGLASVYGIVREAFGSVTVETAVGWGSTFTIFWPRTQRVDIVRPDDRSLVGKSSGTGSAGQRAVLPQPVPGGTLLLVDDEEDVVQTTRKILRRRGYQVLTAGSAAEALALVREEGSAIRALITDVRMPGMSGTELVTTLIGQGVDLPVLFISGQLEAPLPTDWPATVPRRFLAKPFSMDRLHRAVEQILAPGTGPAAGSQPGEGATSPGPALS